MDEWASAYEEIRDSNINYKSKISNNLKGTISGSTKIKKPISEYAQNRIKEKQKEIDICLVCDCDTCKGCKKIKRQRGE